MPRKPEPAGAPDLMRRGAAGRSSSSSSLAGLGCSWRCGVFSWRPRAPPRATRRARRSRSACRRMRPPATARCRGPGSRWLISRSIARSAGGTRSICASPPRSATACRSTWPAPSRARGRTSSCSRRPGFRSSTTTISWSRSTGTSGNGTITARVTSTTRCSTCAAARAARFSASPRRGWARSSTSCGATGSNAWASRPRRRGTRRTRSGRRSPTTILTATAKTTRTDFCSP